MQLPIVQRFRVRVLDVEFVDSREAGDADTGRSGEILYEVLDGLLRRVRPDVQLCGPGRIEMIDGRFQKIYNHNETLPVLNFVVYRGDRILGAFNVYNIETLRERDNVLHVGAMACPGFRIRDVPDAHAWADALDYFLTENLLLADGRELDVRVWEQPTDRRQRWDSFAGDEIGDAIVTRLERNHDRESLDGETLRFRKRERERERERR